MNRKSKILGIIFCLLIGVVLYIYIGIYNRSYPNIETSSTDITITSAALVSSFLIDENASDTKYRGKVIEVSGIVKEITFLNNRNTILLSSDHKYANVLCDMEPNQTDAVKELKQGQKIKIKGVCKGFLNDAIVLNCILINTSINE